MGKYSLDSYQQVDSLAFRPAWEATPPANPGYGLVEAFPEDFPLLPLQEEEGIQEAVAAGRPFALLLSPDEQGWLNTAQALARMGLQKHWETGPVYARLLRVPDRAGEEQLRLWHVKAANQPAGLHLDLRLRRLTCPAAISSKGALPLRLWLQNAGPSPLYGPHTLKLRLAHKAGMAELALSAPEGLLTKTGDIVHNEILHLPALPAGELALGFAVFNREGSPLKLNAALPEQNGWYILGSLKADTTPRPHYFNLWDHWYPDGYYPLEDPKEPKGE